MSDTTLYIDVAQLPANERSQLWELKAPEGYEDFSYADWVSFISRSVEEGKIKPVTSSVSFSVSETSDFSEELIEVAIATAMKP